MSQSARGGTPRRVRITSPRQSAARRSRRRSRYRDLDEETSLGEVYVESLLRAQRRLSLALVLAVVVLVVGVSAVLLVLPEVHEVKVLGVPVVWAALGVLVYPAALGLTHAFVRSAERVEQEFVDLMDLP